MRTWLRDARLKSGKTMAEVAEALGISESYYCYIEAGDRQKNMDITLVMKLSKIFSLSIQQIVELEEEHHDKDRTSQGDPQALS